MRRLVQVLAVRWGCDACGAVATVGIDDEQGTLAWQAAHRAPVMRGLIAEADCACTE